MILYDSFHTIDVDQGECTRRVIPSDFADFINEYVEYATKNDSVKYYTIQNEHTTVVNCINKIANNAIIIGEDQENLKDKLDSCSQAIAEKLVREEQGAQEKIAGTGKKIKKGSLVQALIQTEEQEYLYIVAKVEHTEYFDGESLQKSFGFPSEKKNVWKSAVFPLLIEDEINFETVRVYTDNEAKYWAFAFLELKEEKNDAENTVAAYNAINRELKRNVKKISERDYWILNNAVYQKMKTRKLLNYNDMINELLTGYVPDNSRLETENIKKILLKLPENKKFDSQFTTIPEALKRKHHLRYPVMENVELKINGEVEDVKGAIVSFSDDQGNRYIKIKCDDPSTYQAFYSNQQ